MSTFDINLESSSGFNVNLDPGDAVRSNPANYSGLLQWHDASNYSSLTLEDTNKVAAWGSLSAGNTATASGTTRPTYNATGFGGLPTVEFSGANYLLGALTDAASPRMAAFAVMTFSPTASGSDRILSIAQGAFADWQYDSGSAILTGETGTNNLAAISGSAWGAKTTITPGAAMLATSYYSDTDSVIRVNGDQKSSVAQVRAFAPTKFGIGQQANPFNGAEVMVGSISELILIKGFLEVADIQAIEGYLAHKWGLTDELPVDHPFKTLAPGESPGDPGSSSYTLDVTTTSYNVTSNTIAFNKALTLPITTTLYNVTSNASIFNSGTSLPITTTSYNVTSNTLALNKASTLPITTTSYNVTSNTLALNKASTLPITTTSYLISNKDATLEDRSIFVPTTSYDVSLYQTSFINHRILPIDSVSFDISSTTTNLNKSISCSITPASFTIATQSVLFDDSKSIIISNASIGLTNNEVGLISSRVLPVSVASSSINSNIVLLNKSFNLDVSAISFSVIDYTIELLNYKVLPLLDVSYNVSSNEVSLTKSLHLNVTATSFAVTGSNTEVSDRSIFIQPLEYSLTESGVEFKVDRTVPIVKSSFEINSNDLGLNDLVNMNITKTSFTVTDNSILISNNANLNIDTTSISTIQNSITLVKDSFLNVNNESFIVGSGAIDLVRSLMVDVDTASFTISNKELIKDRSLSISPVSFGISSNNIMLQKMYHYFVTSTSIVLNNLSINLLLDISSIAIDSYSYRTTVYNIRLPRADRPSVGRISGPMLNENLLRHGSNLSIKNNSIDTALLYFDVSNKRIGVNTDSPVSDLEVIGGLRFTDINLISPQDYGNLTIANGTISVASGDLVISAAETTILPGIITDDFLFDGNRISLINSNANMEFVPAGAGEVNVLKNVTATQDLTIQGTLNVTGDVTLIGSILTLGDASSDTIDFNLEFEQDIIPGTNNLHDLGSVTYNWKNLITSDLQTDDLVFFNNVIQTTVLDSNLLLQSTGQVFFKTIGLNNSTVSASDSSLILTSVSNNIEFDSINSLIVAKGTELEIAESPGIIRFNTDINLFETYSDARFRLGGVYSENTQTKLVADLTQNKLTMETNLGEIGVINDNAGMFVRVEIDDMVVVNNSISSSVSNANLEILTTGTGQVLYSSTFGFYNNEWNNTDGVINIGITNEGLVRFTSNSAVVVPTGIIADRPLTVEEGMARYNTEINDLEIYTGTEWIRAYGIDDSVERAMFDDISTDWALIFN